MSNRSDTEQIIRDLFVAYRGSSLDANELVEMAMQALDEHHVFVKETKPVAAGATTMPVEYIDQLVTGLDHVLVVVDEDDYSYVQLYCPDCEDVIDNYSEPSVKTLVQEANEHWKRSHT